MKLGNAIITTLFGVPFFHMGQEIGLSKNGNDNTYNVLNINKMDWSLVDARYDMVHYFRDLISLRKNTPLFHLHDRKDLENIYKIEEKDNGLFVIRCFNKKLINDIDELMIIYNPLNQKATIDLGDDYVIYFHNSGINSNHDNITTHNFMIGPVRMVVLLKVKK